MNIIVNLDLLSVGIVVAAIGVLGFVIFFTNRQGATNRSFLLLALAAICWSILNYVGYQITSPTLVLWLLRFVIFSAVWFAFSIFRLLYVFPQEKVIFPKWHRFLLLPVVTLTSILTLTPFVFSSIATFSAYGTIGTANSGWGIYIFGLLVIFLNTAGIMNLFRKTMRARDKDKRQNQLVLIGILTTVTLLIIFNFILPAFFDNPRFLPFGAVFIFPFILFTFYAIIKHNLFSVKVISTEVLVIVLAVVVFFEVIFSSDLSTLILRSSIFVLVLIFGIFLIRSVLKEVEQRERLEELTRELDRANEVLAQTNEKLEEMNVKLAKMDQLKSEFVSMAGHQLRGPMTVIKGYISLILEGTIKGAPTAVREALGKAMFSTEQLIKLVGSLLDLSRIESGKIKYEMVEGDLAHIMDEVMEKFKGGAEKKGVALAFENHAAAPVKFAFDQDKIREAVVNYMDNAIKYSSAGGRIAVALDVVGSGSDAKARLSIKDAGLGIKHEDIGKLFDKFSRTDEAKNYDPNGMGIGLYFAKRVVQDHGGKAWAESEGIGRGSTFSFELPLVARQEQVK